MGRLDKFKTINMGKADAAADIGLINVHSVKELDPGEVYCFSVVLCDNEVDRDIERFTNASLEAFAPLFLGKPGISDHRWSVEKQIARLYRAETEDGNKKNSLGEQLRVLKGSAYMIRNEASQPYIDAIDGGIMKEISIGCMVEKCCCSICGDPLELDWSTYTYKCRNGHTKGETYDGKPCIGNLENPIEAYEFSFCVVPAQPGAGVTKSMHGLDGAFEALMSADLSGHGVQAKALLPVLQKALMDGDEREERAKILDSNMAYIETYARKG
jgi:hypothetical protein